MKKLKLLSLTLAAILIAGGAIIAYSWMMTETAIDGHRERVATIGFANPSPSYDANKINSLPAPVKRYFEFVFQGRQPQVNLVNMQMEGDFRRPQTEGFSRTKAQQTIAAGIPAFVFSATTPIIPGMWVRVYDAFADFKMEMKAKILSILTVVDEKETPALNRTSIRRWLLEGPLFPMALLPGGPVTWEHVDATHARATVFVNGIGTSLIASFRPDGSLASFHAEEDGDLATPYHGSGEHAQRGDYRLVSGVMIPHTFTISRVSNGKVMPFWKGRITSISLNATP